MDTVAAFSLAVADSLVSCTLTPRPPVVVYVTLQAGGGAASAFGILMNNPAAILNLIRFFLRNLFIA
ncbi:MAG: hypothetical protein QNK11_04740 [Legionella sp.]|nr:hypothetical protein [Legionella sp.]